MCVCNTGDNKILSVSQFQRLNLQSAVVLIIFFFILLLKLFFLLLFIFASYYIACLFGIRVHLADYHIASILLNKNKLKLV